MPKAKAKGRVGSAKVRSPERQAARREALRRREVRQTAAHVGLPEAQRDPGRIDLQTVPQVGRGPRTNDVTVRRLTVVERLRRRGVIEAHEAAACERFAAAAALAWDTTRCTASYDIGGRGGAASAPDFLMAKTAQIAAARSAYRFMVGFIPPQYLPMFEAVVCNNERLSAWGDQLFAGLSHSRQNAKARAALQLCANRLHGGIGHMLPIVEEATPRAKLDRHDRERTAASAPDLTHAERAAKLSAWMRAQREQRQANA